MQFPDLNDLLNQYAENQDPDHAEQDFDQIATQVPSSAMSGGLAEAFRSDQTAPFPNMLGQMFGQSSPDMRAGLLNQLIAMAGPAILSGMMSRSGGVGPSAGTEAGMGGLGGLLGSLLGGGSGFGQGQMPEITAEQASGVTPEAVEEIARQAQDQDPSIIDRVSDFAAQNPGLVKGLGAVAAGIALNHLAKQRRGGSF